MFRRIQVPLSSIRRSVGRRCSNTRSIDSKNSCARTAPVDCFCDVLGPCARLICLWFCDHCGLAPAWRERRKYCPSPKILSSGLRRKVRCVCDLGGSGFTLICCAQRTASRGRSRSALGSCVGVWSPALDRCLVSRSTTRRVTHLSLTHCVFPQLVRTCDGQSVEVAVGEERFTLGAFQNKCSGVNFLQTVSLCKSMSVALLCKSVASLCKSMGA